MGVVRGKAGGIKVCRTSYGLVIVPLIPTNAGSALDVRRRARGFSWPWVIIRVEEYPKTRGTRDVLLYASYGGPEEWIGQRDISFSQNSPRVSFRWSPKALAGEKLHNTKKLRSKLRRTRSRQPRGLTVELSTFSLVSKDCRTFTLVFPSSAICSFYLVSSLRQRQVARSNDLNIKCRVEFALRHTASRQARCRGARGWMQV
ncbi:hypothetical protein ARMGADRAFT_1035358 [Armillaria gallica]|uniref:Uncharacterized protein n=1 Tax=Armillaria gallica TaxID=47427 RepID=A0A2H3DEZ4_ARMGA|nr:hypothetical protein ARMGADRAFT_1035358 [Armillaria gallica]